MSATEENTKPKRVHKPPPRPSAVIIACLAENITMLAHKYGDDGPLTRIHDLLDELGRSLRNGHKKA